MDELAAWLAALGITESPVLDGKIRRVKRDNRASKSAWYIGWSEPFPMLLAGDWRTGEKWTWKRQGNLSRAEKSRMRQRICASMSEAERERDRLRQLAELRASKMLRAARWPHYSAYLDRKQILSFGVRELDGEILVPVADLAGRVWGVQRILSDGQKLFLRGQRVEGCFHRLGAEPIATAVVCEGYATAASIHMATVLPVFAAFSVSNLREVARQLRNRYPRVSLIIAGDDDQWTPGNPGRTGAEATAALVGGRAVFPVFSDLEGRPTDFNDMHRQVGLEAVRQLLAGE